MLVLLGEEGGESGRSGRGRRRGDKTKDILVRSAKRRRSKVEGTETASEGRGRNTTCARGAVASVAVDLEGKG